MKSISWVRKHSAQDTMASIYRMAIRKESTGCLEFQGSMHRKGYGQIRFNGRMEKCHRVVYTMFVGVIPEGAHVLHHCDNRKCCEISHLYLGSNEQNIVDKCTRDRSGKKLCIADVKDIKRRIDSGESCGSLANKYSVHLSSITRIATGKRWSHVNL